MVMVTNVTYFVEIIVCLLRRSLFGEVYTKLFNRKFINNKTTMHNIKNRNNEAFDSVPESIGQILVRANKITQIKEFFVFTNILQNIVELFNV